MGAFLRRALDRRVPFRDLLVGPGAKPRLRLEPGGLLELDGAVVPATACFLRHDVFLPQKTGRMEDHQAALNWHHAVKGWALSRADVRLPNRHARGGETSKIDNLMRAAAAGLAIPPTMVANFAGALAARPAIRKPAGGGALTALLADGDDDLGQPYILQPRLERPEMRVYRAGDRLIGFEIESPDLDYRERHQVTLRVVEVPPEIDGPLRALCGDLGLDFAAADFMRGPEGEWRFLEINTQPMFAAFDRAASGAICDALIDWLLPAAAAAVDERLAPGSRRAQSPVS